MRIFRGNPLFFSSHKTTLKLQLNGQKWDVILGYLSSFDWTMLFSCPVHGRMLVIFIERVATLVSLCGSPCFLVCRILTEVCEDEFHCVRHSWGLHSHWMLFSVPDIDRSLWRQIWMCQRQPRSPFSLLFSVPEIDRSLWWQIWMCQRQPRNWQRSMKTNLNVSETAEVLTEVCEDKLECVRDSRGTDRGLWRQIWMCQRQPRSQFSVPAL